MTSTWTNQLVEAAMSFWAISTLRSVAADVRLVEDGPLPQGSADDFVVCVEMVL